jgi:hypothetical protein
MAEVGEERPQQEHPCNQRNDQREGRGRNLHCELSLIDLWKPAHAGG